MRQETAGVTEALLESAKREFLQYGFHEANLRRISADSGVSTNSIYTRFGDKAGLFSAVVRPAAVGLMELYLASISEASGTDSADAASDMGSEGTERVLKYIYENFDAFRLIFCCSAGTEYEGYFDRLAATEETFYREFVRRYARDPGRISDFFIHVVCRTGWQYVYEVVSHDIPYDEAQEFMKCIREFCFAGWKSVMGAEMSPPAQPGDL